MNQSQIPEKVKRLEEKPGDTALRAPNASPAKHRFPTSGSNSLFDSNALPATLDKLSNADASTVLSENDHVKV